MKDRRIGMGVVDREIEHVSCDEGFDNICVCVCVCVCARVRVNQNNK